MTRLWSGIGARRLSSSLVLVVLNRACSDGGANGGPNGGFSGAATLRVLPDGYGNGRVTAASDNPAYAPDLGAMSCAWSDQSSCEVTLDHGPATIVLYGASGSSIPSGISWSGDCVANPPNPESRIRTATVAVIEARVYTCGVVFGPDISLNPDVTGHEVQITCTSAGQLCEPRYLMSVEPSGPVSGSVRVQASNEQCGDIVFHVSRDGASLGEIGPLGPHEGGLVTLTTIVPGVHTIGIQAEGLPGGCNTGRLASWRALIRLTGVHRIP